MQIYPTHLDDLPMNIHLILFHREEYTEVPMTSESQQEEPISQNQFYDMSASPTLTKASADAWADNSHLISTHQHMSSHDGPFTSNVPHTELSAPRRMYV